VLGRVDKGKELGKRVGAKRHGLGHHRVPDPLVVESVGEWSQ
jgi:hypothetical protein